MAPRTSAKGLPAHRARLGLLSLALLQVSGSVLALETLDEQALSSVTAQDGLTVELSSTPGITTTAVNWITDRGVTNQEATTITAPRLSGDGAPLHVTATLDVDGGNGAGTLPGLALMVDWDPLLFTNSKLTIKTPTKDYSSNSIGNLGMYSQGHLYYINHGGLFNTTAGTATVDFATTGDVIYRQGAVGQPELSFGNLAFSNRFANGSVGIDSQGLVFTAPRASTRLEFDVMYKSAPTTAFERPGRQDIIHFGWAGDLINPVMRISGGGYQYGAVRSEGLNLLAQWDFDKSFGWIIGQAGGNKTLARLYDWQRMATVPSTTPMLSMPVTLDVLQNGVGPAGLCLGGGFASGTPTQASCTAAIPVGIGDAWIPSSVPAGQAAMAVMIRDGHLHAYSQKIKIGSRAFVEDPSDTGAYNWSLLYTFGKLDADFFLYPEGRGAATTGLKTDITLISQSPGYWDKAHSTVAATRASAGNGWATNTHFMLADTAVGGDPAKKIGIGLINADLNWQVRDLFFRIVASNGTGGSTDATYPQIPGGMWMHTDTKAIYNFRGLFGGGNLLDLSPSGVSGIALMNIRLNTTRFLFALHPEANPVDANNAHVGFTGLLDLVGDSVVGAGDGTELSLTEVSSPTTSYKFHDISGRIGWKNGTVGLVTTAGKPSLVIKNELLLGSSANFGTGGGAPLVARVAYGNENFGRIALPAGSWSSEVSIKIP